MPRLPVVGTQDHDDAIAGKPHQLLHLTINHPTVATKAMSCFHNPTPPAAFMHTKVGFGGLVHGASHFRPIHMQTIPQRNLFKNQCRSQKVRFRGPCIQIRDAHPVLIPSPKIFPDI